jgi:iron-sulfur cluster repair protein YtfE (RIC family)
MKRTIILPLIILPLMSSVAFAASDNSNSDSSGVSTNINDKDRSKMDAIGIIERDHAHIRELLAKLDKNLDSNITESRSIFKELKDFLKNHETMEETIWYPELEKNAELKKIIAPLKQEEMDAGKELDKIDSISDPKEWTAKVKKLQKDVEHHAKDEETKLFPKVRKEVKQATLDDLGAKLKEYHDQHDMKN